jgi:hypothetical protein
MSRISPRPRVAAQRQRFLPHHLDAVVLRRVVGRRDLRAALQALAGDGEVHHVRGHQTAIDDVGALLERASDERVGQGWRRQPHVARHGDLRRAEVRDESTADQPRRPLIDLGRI